MRNIFTLLVLFSATCLTMQAQIEGDNIFQNDQIVTIELSFNQTNFWDSLVYNYELEEYMKANLTLTDETGTYSFEDVGVRLKGNSSYGHPGDKKSFKIDFNKFVSGQNYDGLKKLNFSNAFKDPSMLREKVFFDVCRLANVPAPRANFANVYFNGTLWGFYTLIEQIDDQFLDWKILDDDGNLFKAGSNFEANEEAADLQYYGSDQANYEGRYELKSNEEENDWTDLIEFTDFINNSSAAVFESELNNHLEVDEYLTSLALDNLFSNLDSYTGSARNYYIYHNLTTNKWQWIKWDGNESFGSYGGGGGPGGPSMTNLDLDYHDNDRPLIENIFASPVLYAQYEATICNLIEDYFNPDYMNPEIDALKSMIQSSVYADGNKMYTNANFDNNVENNISTGGGPGGGNVYGLKSFIASKYDFVSDELDCSTIIGIDELNSLAVGLYPNPFNDILTLDLDFDQVESVEIYNCVGALVYQSSVNGTDRVELDLTFLEAGVHFIRFNASSTSFDNATLKLIKE